MIKILIVDDNIDKVHRITKNLQNIANFDITNVTHVTNIQEAKLNLTQTSFDLMILDIVLPNRVNEEAVRDAGIQLLDEIIERTRFKKPTHIIGITAYPDTYQQATERFSRRLFNVIRFDAVSDEWVEPLRAKVKHIIAAKADSQNNLEEYGSHLVIICALEVPELSSIRQLNWSWEQHYIPNDDTIYYRGNFKQNEQRHIVYAAAAARMGMPSTAVLAMKMIMAFRPKYLAMTGITAGVLGKVNFGDVIVADPSWDYGSGKWVDADGKSIFEASPHQLQLSQSLRSKFRLLKENVGALAEVKHSWQGEKPDNELALKIGPVASGAAVISDGLTIDRVKLQHRGLLGIEMEAYGLFAAAEEAKEPRPTAFSIKSVVDFADGNKDDRYQKYAAYTSAQALKLFMENYI